MVDNPSPTMLERLLDAIVDQMPPETAEVFTNLYAPDEVKARVDALVEKIMQGGLEPAEQDEYDGLMQIIQTISMIQDRIDARYAGDAPAATPSVSIESIDIGAPAVIPRPTGAPAPLLLDGLEAMLDDLDQTMRPRPQD